MKFSFTFFILVFSHVWILKTSAQENSIGPGQKDTYKAAQEDSGETKNAGYTVMGIHSAASAVCASACATGEVNANVCIGTSMSAGVGDGLVNKNLQGAFAGSMATLGPQIYGSVQNGTAAAPGSETTEATEGTDATKSAETKEKKGDKASCYTAAMHAMQATANAMSAQEASEKADELQQLEDDVTNNDSNNMVLGLGQDTRTSDLNASNGSLNNGRRSGGSLDTSPSGIKNRSCTEARETGQLNAVMNCALKINPALTQMISQPKFHETFKKVSGQDLGAFIRSIPEGAARSPSSVLGAAYGGSGQLGKAEKFQKTFASLDQTLANAHSQKGSYSQFGKRNSSKQKSKKTPEPDPMDFMKNMMAQLTGGGFNE